MKELSIEEKAKRYDEAIERARKIENREPIDVPDGTSIPVAIFPELKESEDETIRGELINFFTNTENGGWCLPSFETRKSWIAWLEKQGEPSSNILWHDMSEEPEKHRELLCEWYAKGDINYITSFHDVAFYHQRDKTFWNGEQQIENVVKWAYIDDLLGEQGEQKFVDKVKPKFNVGDWIVHDMSDGTVTPPFQIIEMTNKSYVLDNEACFYFSDAEKMYRKWTIKDAKDGDVLSYMTDKGDLWIMIYESLCEHYKRHFYYHVLLDNDRLVNNGQCCLCIDDLKPATKEQCNTLFAKIKETGYEWDEEHKQYMLEHQVDTIYDMSFEEAQDYISKRGFDIPWNDGDVMVDERCITQTVANVLKWADRHPLILSDKKK